MSKKKMQRELFEAEHKQRYLEAVAKARAAAGAKAGAASEGNVRGILPYVVEADEQGDCITGRAGLPLVVEAFRGYGGDRLVEQHLSLKQRERGYSETELVEAICLLQASGGEHLDDLEVLRQDGGLMRLLERTLPSPDAAGRFLKYFHEPRLIERARLRAEAARELSFVPEESEGLLGLVQGKLSALMADPALGTRATLDHDATIIESHKDEAAPLRYLAVRIQKRQGHLFADGARYKYLAAVTNMEGDGAE